MDAEDALYEKVARKTLSETLRIKKGETLTVETWDNGLPFARRVVVEAKKLGVVPVMLLEDESAYVEGVRVTPKDVLGTMGKHEQALLAGSDTYVFIPGPPIGVYSKRLSRQEVTESTRYNESWYDAAAKARLRGARLPFGYVGKEYARLYKKKPEDFALHQLKAALVDYPGLVATGKALGQALGDGARATLLTRAGKLEFDLKGELEVEDGVVDEDDVSAGHNMTYVPPGFASKEVDAASATGSVTISQSMTRLGILTDAELKFAGGRLVVWKSKGSPKILAELAGAVQPEKRTLSFVTVGFNPVIKYDFGQDRLVSGTISLGGFGFSGIVRKGTLSAGGSQLVYRGRLAR